MVSRILLPTTEPDMRLIRPLPLLALILLAGASALQAQSRREESDGDWIDRCQNDGNHGYDDRARVCEVRNVPVRLSGRSISIDGRQNGGIRVFGWNGDSVRVTARIQVEDRTDARAKELIKEIRVVADGRSVRAEGPSMEGYDNRSWSVGFVVYVPRRFDLDLEAHNGGLGVSSVNGRLDLRTTNGSVSLDDVGGDVRAHTQNGSLNVQLTGTKWDGAGLDAETRNG